MPSLAAVSSKIIWAEPIRLYEETWNIAYHPGVLTPDFETKLIEVQSDMVRLLNEANDAAAAADDTDDQAEADKRLKRLKAQAAKGEQKFWGLLAEVICDWDITESDDGPKLPIEAATFRRLPSGLVQAFMQAIRADGEPGKAPRPSPNGSASVTPSAVNALTSTS